MTTTRYFDSGVTVNGPLRYRIQLRERGPGIVDQRHVWLPPTPHVETTLAEDWIPGPAAVPPHYRPIPCPDAILAARR